MYELKYSKAFKRQVQVTNGTYVYATVIISLIVI